eukprot:9495836-Pyramimonas_sp.AAC.1
MEGRGYAAASPPAPSPSDAVPRVQGQGLTGGARPKQGQPEREKEPEAVNLDASDEEDIPPPGGQGAPW